MDETQSAYAPTAMPFNTRRLADGSMLAVSSSGDHAFLSDDDLRKLSSGPNGLSLERQAFLKARNFLKSGTHSSGGARLLASRRAAKRKTVLTEPSLHIIVPTLQCGHSCRYCQVSRSLNDIGSAMSVSDIDAACDSVLESKAPLLTVEFQGGDPLLRFDLVQRAIDRLSSSSVRGSTTLRFVVASTLHQLTPAMCGYFKDHHVFLSTSVDGPAAIHNKNRPLPSRDSYERTVASIEMARRLIGPDSVSALMTTTRQSLALPEAIVDEYVRLGLADIFLRPLSAYGFAKRNQLVLAYSANEFRHFYDRAFARILEWNRQGVAVREVYASIILNKILSPIDAGYVDLQSPTGAGSSVLVYNYDGFVYPSDEARMLAETGDTSLRLGRIGVPLETLRQSSVNADLARWSSVGDSDDCRNCVYNQFCAPNPVDAQAQFGTMNISAGQTEHCHRHMWLFDSFYERLRTADDWTTDLFYQWATPARGDRR